MTFSTGHPCNAHMITIFDNQSRYLLQVTNSFGILIAQTISIVSLPFQGWSFSRLNYYCYQPKSSYSNLPQRSTPNMNRFFVCFWFCFVFAQRVDLQFIRRWMSVELLQSFSEMENMFNFVHLKIISQIV